MADKEQAEKIAARLRQEQLFSRVYGVSDCERIAADLTASAITSALEEAKRELAGKMLARFEDIDTANLRWADAVSAIKQVCKSRRDRTGMSEFTEWAKRFEAWVYGQGRDAMTMPATCIYPVKEGPHLRACGKIAPERSPDNYPVCRAHLNDTARSAWRGFVEGA